MERAPRDDADLYDCSDDELWQRLAEPGDVRLDALDELAEREAPGLANYIIAQLNESPLDPSWQCALIFAAELARVDDQSRGPLAQTLLHQVVELDGRRLPEEKPAIWSGLRKISVLGNDDALPQLAQLLDSPDIQTRQATFQAITTLATGLSLPPEHAIATKVHELAVRYSHPDILVSAANVALAASAIHAAQALLGDQVRDELRGLVRSAGRVALTSLCADILKGD